MTAFCKHDPDRLDHLVAQVRDVLERERADPGEWVHTAAFEAASSAAAAGVSVEALCAFIIVIHSASVERLAKPRADQ